jgi:hypothetical protein
MKPGTPAGVEIGSRSIDCPTWSFGYERRADFQVWIDLREEFAVDEKELQTRTDVTRYCGTRGIGIPREQRVDRLLTI